MKTEIHMIDRSDGAASESRDGEGARSLLFIAWVPYNRRSESLAEKLDAEYCPIHILKYKKVYNVPVKYVYQTIRTVITCLRRRPDIIFVQNPPIFCPLVVYSCSKFIGARIVIDSHSAAFMSKRWRWSSPIHRFVSRRALANIVTNDHFASIVSGWGGRPFILRDIPIVFPAMNPPALAGARNIVFICTYSDDEPIDEVLGAATGLPDVHFYITGDLANMPKRLRGYEKTNVTFTGFLPEEDYVGLLQACDGVLVLTEREHTLLRGACEAVSVGRPLVISDTRLLREYFPKGAIHVENDMAAIREGIRRLFRERWRLEKEILALRDDRWVEWESKWDELMQLLDGGERK